MAISQAPEWDHIFTLLLDPAVSEVQSNGPNLFFIKKNGVRIRVEVPFQEAEGYISGIERGLAPFVESANAFRRDGSLFEGRMKFSSGGTEIQGRCHITLPPVAEYAQVTIAKKTASLKSIDSIAAMGSMSTEMMEFLNMAVTANLTIVFSGGTGAGKSLHKDTLIPTPRGLKRVADIHESDTIFDDTGQKTQVTKKNSPEESNFYALTYSNGEKIKAGGGHIWKISETGKNQHKNTIKISDDAKERILESLATPDNMLTINELVSVVTGTSSGTHDRSPELVKLFKKEVKGFGITGGDLIAFDKFELIEKILKTKSDQASDAVKRLESVSANSITLKEFIDTVDDSVAYRVLGEVAASVEKVYYNKNETLSHILKLSDTSNAKVASNSVSLVTTDEIFSTGIKLDGHRSNFAIEKVSAPVWYDERDLTVDPYTIGAWLGAGDSGALVGVDYSVIKEIRKTHPHVVSKGKNADTNPNELAQWEVVGLAESLAAYRLGGNKHIPVDYKISSISQRKALIAGLVDTSGAFDEKRSVAKVVHSNASLIEDVREVASSLGWVSTNVVSGEVNGVKSYSVAFHVTGIVLDLQVVDSVSIKVKKEFGQKLDGDYHYIVGIEKIEGMSEDYFCFGVDSPSHMYLCGESFIPTHNTTMLEALVKNIPDSLRVGVAEDTPELVLTQPNVSYLHSVPWQPGMSENDVATLSWVIQQFQRMRTDKIIVGETRGKEFADFLIAANSGMEGSMTTIHADDPTRCLMKMTNFALKGAERQPIRAINADIANAVDIIVQLVIINGKHRISHIQEIVPTLGNTDEAKITTAPLYLWDRQKDMFYKETGMTDALRDRITGLGINIDAFVNSARNVRVPAHTSTRMSAPPVQQRASSRGIPSGLPSVPQGRSL